MMTPVSECLYCQCNDTLHNLMIKICDMEVSELFLFREQTYPGRCNVVYKEHGIEFHELSEDQRNAFIRDVASAGTAIAGIFKPDKINYGSYADKLSHLHIHVVPKYNGGYSYGGVFEMNPQKVFLSESQYKDMAQKLKDALLK